MVNYLDSSFRVWTVSLGRSLWPCEEGRDSPPTAQYPNRTRWMFHHSSAMFDLFKEKLNKIKRGKNMIKKKLISEQKDRRLSSKYRNDHPKNGGISQLQLSSLNHDGVHDVYGHHFSKSQQPTFITRQSWQPQRSFNAKKKLILAPPGRRLVNCRAAGSRLFDGTTWHQLDLSMLIANIF